MSFTTDELYQLLPAIYRIRDAEQGEPLKALLAVIAGQARVMEDDIAGLYENWFIETCQEWVVPYLGDLLGVRGLHPFGQEAAFSQRARVANTLGYRRRKGTATMLEQLARDTTGWNARVVEFFELLGWTQYYNHVRLHNHRTPDLRRTDALELLDTAFDTAAHTVDVRHIASGRGRHNISNVGIFLWRLQSYFIPQSQARAVVAPPDGRYWIHPFGLDAPLFNRPQTETEITHLAEEINVPGRLRRRPLYDELEARRQALAEGRTPAYRYFDDRPDAEAPPVFEVYLDGTLVSPDEVLICNLEDWHLPADFQTYQVPQPVGPPVPVNRAITVAVDPVLGRLTVPASITPGEVRVSYAYGFPGDVGGGPYNRRDSLETAFKRSEEAASQRAVTWQVGVSRDVTAVGGETIFTTLTDAVVAWNAQPAGTVGLIAILDNSTFEEDLVGVSRIEVPEGSLLVIAAADWPAVRVPGGAPGQQQRPVNRYEPDERRAHLRGDLSVIGTAAPNSETPGALVVDGLLIEGAATVLAGHLGGLRLAHATLPAGLTVNPSVNPALQNENLRVQVDRCISGPLLLPDTLRGVQVADSILEAPRTNGNRGPALAADAGGALGPEAVIERTTVLGSVHVEVLRLASEVIFIEPVTAERLQTGCVRFSYLPAGSQTPRRYRCQPDLALRLRADELGLTTVAALPAAEADLIRLRLRPGFTSTRYGDPGYGQLSQACAEEICTGAEDGSEMGAWSFLKQPQRAANLRTSLEEYLRFGLEAGLLFVT